MGVPHTLKSAAGGAIDGGENQLKTFHRGIGESVCGHPPRAPSAALALGGGRGT